jgi:hypothetical protein
MVSGEFEPQVTNLAGNSQHTLGIDWVDQTLTSKQPKLVGHWKVPILQCLVEEENNLGGREQPMAMNSQNAVQI